MKFICSTKDITAAVGAAAKIVNGSTTVPILANVLITAERREITVRTTDLEVTLERKFPAVIAEPAK